MSPGFPQALGGAPGGAPGGAAQGPTASTRWAAGLAGVETADALVWYTLAAARAGTLDVRHQGALMARLDQLDRQDRRFSYLGDGLGTAESDKEPGVSGPYRARCREVLAGAHLLSARALDELMAPSAAPEATGTAIGLRGRLPQTLGLGAERLGYYSAHADRGLPAVAELLGRLMARDLARGRSAPDELQIVPLDGAQFGSLWSRAAHPRAQLLLLSHPHLPARTRQQLWTAMAALLDEARTTVPARTQRVTVGPDRASAPERPLGVMISFEVLLQALAVREDTPDELCDRLLAAPDCRARLESGALRLPAWNPRLLDALAAAPGVSAPMARARRLLDPRVTGRALADRALAWCEADAQLQAPSRDGALVWRWICRYRADDLAAALTSEELARWIAQGSREERLALLAARGARLQATGGATNPSGAPGRRHGDACPVV